MYLINIDKPTRTCTIHESKCNTVLLRDTDRKGIEIILIDGGWFRFNSKEEALEEYENNHSKFELKECGKCMGRDKV